MFGKHFKQMYTGSMAGSGPVVFALWGYIISNADEEGNVEVNKRIVATAIGCSVEDIALALQFLQQPDPDSRSTEEQGKRLVQEGPFAYRIVTYQRYRLMRSNDDRREYMREYMRKYRAEHGENVNKIVNSKVNGANSKVNVNTCKPVLAKGRGQKVEDRGQREKARARDIDEVVEFALEQGMPATDGEWFFETMQAGGWMRGKSRIKDWRAHFRSWKQQKYLASQKAKTNESRPTRNGAANAKIAAQVAAQPPGANNRIGDEQF